MEIKDLKEFERFAGMSPLSMNIHLISDVPTTEM
jgi:hypothetical protein